MSSCIMVKAQISCQTIFPTLFLSGMFQHFHNNSHLISLAIFLFLCRLVTGTHFHGSIESTFPVTSFQSRDQRRRPLHSQRRHRHASNHRQLIPRHAHQSPLHLQYQGYRQSHSGFVNSCYIVYFVIMMCIYMCF